ncbi:MAG: hypothetical protein AAFX99_20840, partial [Myxococcota bacterium]
STASFDFDTKAPETPGFGEPALDPDVPPTLVDVEAEVSANLIDVSAWYFIDVTSDVEFGLRAGFGYAQGTVSAGGGSSDGSGMGALAGVILGWRVREAMLLNLDLSWRWADVPVGVDDNVSVFSLAAGVGWGP